MASSPLGDEGDFNFEKLKSLWGYQVHLGGTVIMVTKEWT